MTPSIFLLLLLSAVQVSCVFNCYKCSSVGITDPGTNAAVTQFLASYLTFQTNEPACASNPVTQLPGCTLACVHIKLMIDFSHYAGPAFAPYTLEQIQSLGQVPVSVRDCLEAQWPSIARYIVWGYLPPINPAKSCVRLVGGIFGSPVVGEMCLANTGNNIATNPDLNGLVSNPAQMTATQARLPTAYQDCSEAYMPNSNLATILTMAGFKVPTTVDVKKIDPFLRNPTKLAQLENNNLNLTTCFFPEGAQKQGCTQMAYWAGLRVNMTAYSGGDILFSQLLRVSQGSLQAFNYTSAIARGCISDLPAKGLPVPGNLAYQSIPEGNNCFQLDSNIWDLQLSSTICLCNKDGCNTVPYSPLFASSAMSLRYAISVIALPFLVSLSLIGC